MGYRDLSCSYACEPVLTMRTGLSGWTVQGRWGGLQGGLPVRIWHGPSCLALSGAKPVCLWLTPGNPCDFRIVVVSFRIGKLGRAKQHLRRKPSIWTPKPLPIRLPVGSRSTRSNGQRPRVRGDEYRRKWHEFRIVRKVEVTNCVEFRQYL